MMVLAAGVHVSIGELPVVNVVLAVVGGFVGWGRFRKAPIARAQPPAPSTPA
jgi:hypothetical protein